MATLIIRKVLGGIWEHEPSDAQLFILSNWYVKVNVPYFQLQEIGGSQRKIYLISQITVFDINGGPETFANFTALMVRLKALDYTAFEQGSGGGGGVVINDNTPSLTEVYSSQKVEDSFVPLSGTAESFPITGILKFKNGESNAEIENNADDGLQIKSTLDGRNKQGLALINVSQVYLSINDFDNQFNSALNLVHEELSLSLSKASAKGLKGDQDFTANYPTDGSEDKIFPQIKYVKDKFQRLPRLVNANTTALNNEILHVTADATITDVVDAIAGNFFTVRVLGGIATVDGVAYGVGTLIARNYDGTVWTSQVGSGGGLRPELIFSEFKGDNYFSQITPNSINNVGYNVNPTAVGSPQFLGQNINAEYINNPFDTSFYRRAISTTTAGSTSAFIWQIKVCRPSLGFYCSAKAGGTFSTNGRNFFGLTESFATIGSVNPSTVINTIGFGADADDTNLHIIHNDGSGVATKINLGADFPKEGEQIYILEMWNFFNETIVYFRIKNLKLNITSEVIQATTNLPNIGLAFQLWSNNGIDTLNNSVKFTNHSIKRQS